MNTLTINTTNTSYKNTSILFFAFLLFFFAHSPLNAATMFFDNGFESGDLSGYKVHAIGGTVTAKKSPVAAGNYSGEFDLQFGSVSADNYRSEVQIEGTKNYFIFETEYWFSFKYNFTDWAKDSSPEFAPFQIHARPSSWDDACRMGSAHAVAPFFMMVQNDIAYFKTYGGITRWSAPVIKNQWQTITVHFKPSTSSTGYIEAWHNGVKIVSVNGANQPVKDGCGGLVQDPYWNMGIYKWDWRTGRPATESSRRTFYIDSLKVAQGADGYSMVASTPTTTPTPIQDTTPPAINNVQAAVTDTTATITWDTNEASDSAVNYGTTTSYGLNAGNSLSVTSHSVTVQNLTSNSLYHYKVSSKDSSGNTGSGTDLTFTTNRAAGEELVAYWPMDPGTGTTLPDLSGNGHTGKLVNGALLTTSGGVKFDGIDDYADVGKFDVGGNAISISAWVWSDSLSNCTASSCRIISKAVSNAEQDQYFMVSPITVGSATRLRFLLKVNGVTSVLTAASGNLSNKVWFHVAAVYDGQTMRLYKDGVEVGSMAKSGSMTTNSSAPVWIGGNPPNAKARPWKGQIDDVSLYSYALTKEEIAELAK